MSELVLGLIVDTLGHTVEHEERRLKVLLIRRIGNEDEQVAYELGTQSVEAGEQRVVQLALAEREEALGDVCEMSNHASSLSAPRGQLASSSSVGSLAFMRSADASELKIALASALPSAPASTSASCRVVQVDSAISLISSSTPK